MIKTVNLTKNFDKLVALDNLNLEIPNGEIFGFLGPNGAGKTTTVKLLTGLLRPTSGQALLNGIDIEKNPIEVKKIIGLVPDQPFLYQKLTGEEYLNFVADLYELPAEKRSKKNEILKTFGLDDWANELIESYSHGMQQKLVLSGIILRRPEIIFLDEPLVGLDPQSARLIKKILLQLAEEGTTIFLCTHILEIAEKLCHRVGIIQKGKLTDIGNLEELKQKAQIDGNLEEIFFKLTE